MKLAASVELATGVCATRLRSYDATKLRRPPVAARRLAPDGNDSLKKAIGLEKKVLQIPRSLLGLKIFVFF